MDNNPPRMQYEHYSQNQTRKKYSDATKMSCGVVAGCLVIAFLISVVIFSNKGSSAPPGGSDAIARPTSTSKPTPALQAAWPPKTVADLHALAAKGDPSAIHEFHSEGVGLVTCPQPKREVTVDASLTGQQLAEDLLAYFYTQGLDNNCGSLVGAYHDQGEAGDVYTAGRILLQVSGSKHTLTLNTGDLGTGQEYVVEY